MAKVELTLKEYDELKMYKDIVEGMLDIRIDEWGLDRYKEGVSNNLMFVSYFCNNTPKRIVDQLFEILKERVKECIELYNLDDVDMNSVRAWDTMPVISFSVRRAQE
jgi:hypothetical protein